MTVTPEKDTTNAKAATFLPAATLDPRRRRLRLYRAEFAKVFTTDAWWSLTVVNVLSIGIALIASTANAHNNIGSAKNPPDLVGVTPDQADLFSLTAVLRTAAADIYTSGQFLGVFIIMVFAGMMVSNEFQHQTATTTFLGEPRRAPVIAAKFAAAATIAAVLWLVTTAVNLLVGVLFLRSEGFGSQLGDPAVLRPIVLGLPLYVVWALFGVGLGALMRNQLPAVTAAAALYLIVGTVALSGFMALATWLHQSWIEWLALLAPSIASQVMISQTPPFDFSPPAWVGGAILAVYAIGTTLLGTAVIRRKDIA